MLQSQNLLIFISFFVYFLFSLIFSYYSYPQEDALILFRYANNLAETGVISFNLHGEITEGGTDFLWLLVLAMFKLFGFDPYVSTIIFSSLSLAIILRILIREIAPNKNIFFYIFILIIFLNIGQIVGASILGFSTLIFCCLGLILYRYAYRKNYNLWTIFSVIFCLFRPEALIFFIPSIFMIFEKNKIKLLLIHLSIITLIGITYFICRYLYFGEFLPLPLMVKQIGGELSVNRFFATVSMIISTLTISLIIPIFIYLFTHKNSFFSFKNEKLYFLIIISIFSIFYVLSLSSGYSSQNIFFRYFAPIYFIIFIMSVFSLAKISNRLIILCITIIIFGSIDNSNLLNRFLNIENRNISNPTYKLYKEFTENSYKNHPLVKIGNSIGMNKKNDIKIMLTEAGAIPYLSNSIILDMVGLNTKKYAKNPVICEDFISEKPDLVEIDVGPISQFNFKEGIVENDLLPYCGIFDKEYLYQNNNILNKDSLFLIESYKTNFSENHLNATVRVAAFNTLFCMMGNKSYDKIFINKKSDQIYFFNSLNSINDILLESCNINNQGYFE